MTPVADAVANQEKLTTERFDIAFGIKTSEGKDKDGNVLIKKEAVTLDPEVAAELEKENKFEGNQVTVSVDYPANWAGLLAYADKTYKDEEGNVRDTNEVLDEIVKLFRVGAKGKVMNRMRAQLTKTDDAGNLTFKDEDAPGGILDLTDEITSGSKRVFLTEEQKTWRSLSNLPENIRKQMYDVYLTSIGKATGNYPQD
jgi:hypothetical protein